MSMLGPPRERPRMITSRQLRRLESNGWRITEYVGQNGRIYANLVNRGGRVRTVRVVSDPGVQR